MLATILQSIVRQARRHPLFFALNLFGLSLGVGVFLTLSLLVRYEYAFNATLPDVNRLVRVDSRWTLPGNAPTEYGAVTFRALPFFRQDFPEIEAATKLEGTELTIRRGSSLVTFDGTMTDQDFFKVFGISLMHGSPTDALSRPDGLVLSAHAAKTIFGTTDVMGRTVTVGRGGAMKSHVITGILAEPTDPGLLNTTDIFMPYTPEDSATELCFSDWGSDCGSLYFKLRHPSDIAFMNTRMRTFVTQRVAADDAAGQIGAHPERIFALSLVPLTKTRFLDFFLSRSSDGVDQTVINSIGLTGLLALALACANAVNLGTARAALRAREVALRKTLGATGNTLFVHFMGEAIMIAALAAGIGMALCELLLPEIASLTGEHITIHYGFMAWTLPPVVLACGFASGFYPAWVLARYRPATVLTAAKMPSGGRTAARLRDLLIASQFTIAVTIVVCMLVINCQTTFIRNTDHGFARAGLLIGGEIPQDDIALQRAMIDALRRTPGVTAAGFGELSPNPSSETRTTYDYASPHGTIHVHLLHDIVGPGYKDAYRPHLVAGRWFNPSYGQDDAPPYDNRKSRITNAIVNETAAVRFGFTKPDDMIGKILDDDGAKFLVIGVIADIRFESPRQPVYPEILAFNTLSTHPFSAPLPAVRFQGVTTSEMQSRLNHAWETILPNIAGSFRTPDDRMTTYYQGDERRGNIFAVGGATALLIACLGLYGLSSFAAARRIHEIGIRKTLGASANQVLTLLLRDFLRPVLLACIVACPVAWAIMRQWLAGFDERISLQPSYFLIAVAGALCIATLTVLGQTIRVARAEPARALRTE